MDNMFSNARLRMLIGAACWFYIVTTAGHVVGTAVVILKQITN